MGDDVEQKPQPKAPLIDYPTVYTFKVMGRQEHAFGPYVRQLFRRLMGSEISDDSISEQPSRQGRYVSISVSVYLLSEEHRKTIYEQLHKEKRVLYYL